MLVDHTLPTTSPAISFVGGKAEEGDGMNKRRFAWTVRQTQGRERERERQREERHAKSISAVCAARGEKKDDERDQDETFGLATRDKKERWTWRRWQLAFGRWRREASKHHCADSARVVADICRGASWLL